MATQRWAIVADVEERLGVTATAKGYTESDIEKRLSRAQEDLRGKLQAVISSNILDAWLTENNTPKVVRNLTADLAAAYCFADLFGDALLDKTCKGGSLYGKVQDDLKRIRTGELNIVDVSDSDVSPAEDSIWSTTQSFRPIFEETHPDDDSVETKRLDEF